MTSEKAQKFIGKKIALLRHEGVPEKKAVGEAFGIARQKGYRIPKR